MLGFRRLERQFSLEGNRGRGRMQGEKMGEVERKRVKVKQRKTENTHICDGHQLCVYLHNQGQDEVGAINT